MSKLLRSLLDVEIFGESHAPAIGAVIEGFPAGLKIDFDRLAAVMAARRASLSAHSTKRIEEDDVEFVCGVKDGVTTGAAVCLVIRNANVRSADYDNLAGVPRPSHADYPAHVRYRGFEDARGGGQFSGRLTAPVVAAGELCAQWLEPLGVTTFAAMTEVGGVELSPPCAAASELPQSVRDLFGKLAAEKNSCGGIIAGAIRGLPTGLGGTMADSVESRLSSLLYAIPAVKGVEFGLGFGFARGLAQEVNDPYTVREGRILPATNCNGGVLGGLTTGAEVAFRACFKPVPSIAAKQCSVDWRTNEEVDLEIKGRHDVCILPRAVPVVRAVAALCAADLMLGRGRE